MKITNFTQDGGTDRAVVEVTLPGDTENGGTHQCSHSDAN